MKISIRKDVLENFISKYNVRDINQVIWNIDKELMVSTLSDDRNFGVTVKQSLDSNTVIPGKKKIYVPDTKALKKLLSVLNNNIEISFIADDKDSDRLIYMVLEDGESTVNYLLGDPSVFNKQMNAKELGPPTISTRPSLEHIQTFIQARNALSTETLVKFDSLVSKKGKVRFNFGIKKNRQSTNIDCFLYLFTGTELTRPILFSADDIKDVLSILLKEKKEITLELWENSGLCKISMNANTEVVEYYCMEKKDDN